MKPIIKFFSNLPWRAIFEFLGWVVASISSIIFLYVAALFLTGA